ncbi:MAG: 16S rRNA (cytidine(1402)-2'-O)-methyltransferase [Gammaproteobacteria bacterium]|nr:16S rRNA (cytidine(1402)-2'-O)-methyltransferase [Gammaproteobacteria bacterium]
MMAGTLYVVATPIGNLADMVPRALDILKTVALVAAEDTRHSGRLLRHFGIATRLVSYHDRGEADQGEAVLAALADGRDVALISDAGTPLISDPGYRLVRAARAAGFAVSPVPGACAAVAALSVAGLPCDRFVFEGFLPARAGERLRRLEALAQEPRTLIFYEAPHRIQETLADIATVFGAERELVLGREISKAFETFLTGSAAEVGARVAADANQRRGELVLMVAGAPERAPAGDDLDRVLSVLLEELPLKQAVGLAARITGAAKNQLYERALALRAP